MSIKQSHPTEDGKPDLRDIDDMEFPPDLSGQSAETTRKTTNPNIWLKAAKPAEPRILIASDDNAVCRELEAILLHAGFLSERVKSMSEACDSAKSGRFQVVVTAPLLHDGSWKRLTYIDRHYRPGFVIIVVATNSDMNEWGSALESGAFEVLDVSLELHKVAEIARRAMWAAYLKGAGPRPEIPVPAKVS